RRSANVVAAELFERALTAADHLELPPSEGARVAEALGDGCEPAARYEQGMVAYARARRLTDDGPAQARLMRKEGIVCERSGSYVEALGWYERGLGALDASSDPADGMHGRVELELATAGVKYRQGDFAEGVDWSTRAAEHAEAGEDPPALRPAHFR